MFVNDFASDKQVPNFPKKVIQANKDDDVAVQEALANWVTFTTESDLLESLETATMYLSEDFELYDVVLLDALSVGHAYKDREDTAEFKAAISKR
jgi:hypothetical protein